MKTEIFKTKELNALADLLLNNGMRIFYSNSPLWRTYFHFTDGVNIGYCQEGDFGGIRFSTVHKPCIECGTSFGLQAWDEPLYEPTIEDAKKAFITAPKWAKRKDVQAVRKYTLDEFIKSRERDKDFTELNQYSKQVKSII